MGFIPQSEINLIENRREVLIEQRGILKIRLKNRLKELKNKNLPSALSILTEEERVNIAKNILNSLNITSLEELTNEYKNFFEKIKKEKELSNFIKRMKGIRLNSQELKKILENSKNKKDISKVFKKIIATEEFVIKRKIKRDGVHIRQTTKKIYYSKRKRNLSIDVFNELKKKKQVKIKNFIQKGKIKGEIIKDFYERGIILSKNIKRKDFIEQCKKQILKIKNIDKIDFPDIFPFKYKKSSENEIVRLNPYYKHFKFQASS